MNTKGRERGELGKGLIDRTVTLMGGMGKRKQLFGVYKKLGLGLEGSA